MNRLLVLHTVPALEAVIEEALAERAPEQCRRHLVRPDLLDLARTNAPAEEQTRAMREALRTFEPAPGDLLLCTCSSIGGLMESTAAQLGWRGLRIDRPMAEAAVARGGRLLVVATLESTVEPTTALLREVAATADRTLTLTTLVCRRAWEWMSAGRREDALAAVAAEVRMAAGGHDAVVLAQASMAEAASLCQGLGVPVLSSPGLGVERALALLRRSGV